MLLKKQFGFCIVVVGISCCLLGAGGVSARQATLPPDLEAGSQEPAKKPARRKVANGTLVVNTDPSDAWVKVMTIGPKYRRGISLPAGTHKIQAGKAGYETAVKYVKVHPGKQSTLNITLTKQSVPAPPPEPVPAPVPAPVPSPAPAPIQPAPKRQERGDIRYQTTHELRQALEQAAQQKKLLGHTQPFDAFATISGKETVSAAFIPVGYPQHKIFCHAFYAPGKAYNLWIYGYTVIDMVTSRDYGHFDGNADGKFEQNTLQPTMYIASYKRVSKFRSGDKIPELH